jgi:hypothetical protein
MERPAPVALARPGVSPRENRIDCRPEEPFVDYLPMKLRRTHRLNAIGWFLSLLACCSLATPAVLAQTNSGNPPGAGNSSVGDGSVRPVPRSPVIINSGSRGLGSPRLSTSLSALLPIYFPPTPPVLGAELPPQPAVRDSAWNELTPWSNEPFFAPLSTRLAQGDLNRKHREKLDTYKTTQAALLAELRTQLDAVASAAPSAHKAALQTLATAQEPRLQQLAADADELRRELYRYTLLTQGADWNEHRNWHLGGDDGKRTAREKIGDEHSVVRASIYYQEGLSSQQRGLLKEIVIELAAMLGEVDTPPASDGFEPDQFLFFMPHGSRLRVPSDISADLSSEIAAFTAEKTALKRELREAIFSLDRETPGKRERALRDLAAAHEPRFAALEAKAEHIRESLSTIPALQPAAPPTEWPPALAARMSAYLNEKAEFQKAAQRQAQDAGKNSSGKKSPDASANGREALAEFEDKNRARLAALTAEARAIREEVARIAKSRTEKGAGKSVDALLGDFMQAYKQEQLQKLYRDYHIAVLEPGLSSGQRQLLFDAAIASLDLTGVKDWQAVPE